jgi:hypothetical protein
LPPAVPEARELPSAVEDLKSVFVLFSDGGARATEPLEADMSTSADISVLYREFTDSLTEVLAETAGTPVRRGRLARAHAAVKKHPNYNEHEYFLASRQHSRNGKECKTSAAKTINGYAARADFVALRSARIPKLVGCSAR